MFKNYPHKIALLGLLAFNLMALFSSPANALPSYARQTGEECAACHVGSIGPQLTPHGAKFKMEGYADGKSPSWYVPLSAQAIAGYTNTAKGQEGGAAPGFSSNDNKNLQEASVFVAGRVAEGLGTFMQWTYSDVDRHSSWDQVDVRYARTIDISGKDTIIGVSLNNNPTVSDPFNTLMVWNFPYTSSDLTPGYTGTPILSDGISQQVLGLTAYTQWNDWIYAEAGAYHKLGSKFRDDMGVEVDDQIAINGLSPYFRVAVNHSFNHQYASLGFFGLDTKLQPDPANPAEDKYQDFGVDGSYQYLGTRKHTFTANARYTHESRTLNGTFDAGGADSAKGHVSEYNLNGSYYYLNTYGATIGAFGTRGNTDATLYGEDSASGSPSTTGMIYQLDWTPFGKEGSWMAPWANLRLALQYTTYSKFNGRSSDYDGNGRSASDNDTLFAWIWLAI
ncbi:cytochrome C [Hydrocarboniphaga sp.]|uniref:cytochrome C n=1 Tax=Hydrocarboniphaga sp. TaxID=2033016 RepID=UPI003D09CADD